MADAQIRLKAYNITRKGLAEVKRGLSGLASFTMSIGRRMRGAFRGVFRGLTDIRTLLAGGGIAAGLVTSVKQAQKFAEAMAEVSTLVPDPKAFEGLADGVRELSTELGIAKEELTKGLYQAISAGVPPDNAIAFLRDASKGAVAGVASVTESVDILTTVLNAFRLSADKSEAVSDILFTTVRLGKTTLSELAAAMAIVAPIASASGVAIDQVAAAIATLTKGGTPTTQAVTQIRAAIISMNEVLGDGWSKTKTLNQGMLEMAKRAGGSQSALRVMVGRVEAMSGILGLTGKNARMAADDFKAMTSSAGAMSDAFGKMDKVKTWARLFQSVAGFAERLGAAINRGIGNSVKRVTGLINWLAKDTAFMDNVGKKFGAMFKAIEDNFGGFVRGVIRKVAVAAAVLKMLLDPERRKEMMGAIGGVIKAGLIDGGLALAGLIMEGIKSGAAFLVNELLRVMPILGDMLLSKLPAMFGGRPSTAATREAAVKEGAGMVERYGSQAGLERIKKKVEMEREGLTRSQKALKDFADTIRDVAMGIEVNLLKQLPRIPVIVDGLKSQRQPGQGITARRMFQPPGPLGFKRTSDRVINQLELSKSSRIKSASDMAKREREMPGGGTFIGMRLGRLPSGLKELGSKSAAGGAIRDIGMGELFDIMQGAGRGGAVLGTMGNPMITEVIDGMPEVE